MEPSQRWEVSQASPLGDRKPPFFRGEDQSAGFACIGFGGQHLIAGG